MMNNIKHLVKDNNDGFTEALMDSTGWRKQVDNHVIRRISNIGSRVIYNKIVDTIHDTLSEVKIVLK